MVERSVDLVSVNTPPKRRFRLENNDCFNKNSIEKKIKFCVIISIKYGLKQYSSIQEFYSVLVSSNDCLTI